jgi:hypothetical protein
MLPALDSVHIVEREGLAIEAANPATSPGIASGQNAVEHCPVNGSNGVPGPATRALPVHAGAAVTAVPALKSRAGIQHLLQQGSKALSTLQGIRTAHGDQ